LGQEFVFEFNTPTVRIVRTIPSNDGHQELSTPLFFVEFDQDVESESVIKTVRFFNGRSTLPVSPVLASLADLDQYQNLTAREKIVSLIRSLNAENKYILFTVSQPFPRETLITVKLGPLVRNIK
jgi:hypothetical protein